ncbi:MAG: LamG domain-containing protein [Candidatus Firestonebacteria bacterium]
MNRDNPFDPVNIVGGGGGGNDISDTNLVGYWKFDEGSGNTANDSSTNGNNGTISTATWTTGKYGNALNFNNNGTVIVPHSSSLNIGSNFTIISCVYLRSAGWSPTILAKGENSNYKIGFYAGTKKYYFTYYSNGSWRDMVGGTDTILSLSQWYYVATIVDVLNNQIKYYIDGTLADTINGNFTANPLVTNTGNLEIGHRTNGEYINGIIDEVRIYNRAFNSSEISTDYKKCINIQ